jgi:hypothetical protein
MIGFQPLHRAPPHLCRTGSGNTKWVEKLSPPSQVVSDGIRPARKTRRGPRAHTRRAPSCLAERDALTELAI